MEKQTKFKSVIKYQYSSWFRQSEPNKRPGWEEKSKIHHRNLPGLSTSSSCNESSSYSLLVTISITRVTSHFNNLWNDFGFTLTILDSMPRKSWLGNSWVLTRCLTSRDSWVINWVIESDSWLELIRESSCHSNDSWQALVITCSVVLTSLASLDYSRTLRPIFLISVYRRHFSRREIGIHVVSRNPCGLDLIHLHLYDSIFFRHVRYLHPFDRICVN